MTTGPGQACDGETIARLRLIAEEAARRNEGSALIAQAVQSTLAHAAKVISGDGVSGEQPVWVIQVEGTERFTCVGCHRPPRAPSPRGRFLRVVLDAQSWWQSSFGIGDVKADLSQLGEVVTLIDEGH